MSRALVGGKSGEVLKERRQGCGTGRRTEILRCEIRFGKIAVKCRKDGSELRVGWVEEKKVWQRVSECIFKVRSNDFVEFNEWFLSWSGEWYWFKIFKAEYKFDL